MWSVLSEKLWCEDPHTRRHETPGGLDSFDLSDDGRSDDDGGADECGGEYDDEYDERRVQRGRLLARRVA